MFPSEANEVPKKNYQFAETAEENEKMHSHARGDVDRTRGDDEWTESHEEHMNNGEDQSSHNVHNSASSVINNTSRRSVS